MKLLKLYSNDSRFKTVTFKNGLNLVIANITKKNSKTDDIHNLGKTKLIELIDFMLLKELKSRNFLKKPEFIDHIFYLEIELKNSKTLTIKRSIKKNTKISFKLSNDKYNDFTNESFWDFSDLALNSSDPATNPKVILDKLLNFNVLSNYNYRNSINYFLRTQNDYNAVFHLSKYMGSQSSWKPLVFELLGYDPIYMNQKYDKSKELETEKEILKELQKRNQISAEEFSFEKEKLKEKEAKRNKLKETLETVNFFSVDKYSLDKLSMDIETAISEVKTKIYYLKIEIKNLQKSYCSTFNFDLDKVVELFKEVEINFPQQLKKSYSELLNFNKIITEDRNNIINYTIEKKKQKLLHYDTELSNLYSKKNKLIDSLLIEDTFEKYKYLQNELINLEKEIELSSYKLTENASQENNNSNEEEAFSSIDSDIKKAILNLEKQLTKPNEIFNFISSKFTYLVNYIINQKGNLSLTLNSVKNVDFNVKILDSDSAETSQDDGYTYKKILCACFDISLLLCYSRSIYNYFSFVFHDGCLESLDPRKQKNYLDLISSICNDNDVQYILTLLESDIPTINGEKYSFPNDYNIAVSFSDKDESETLFGFNF